MKNILIAFLFSSSLFASQVPSSWMVESSNQKNDQGLASFEKYFESVMSVQEEMLESSESSIEKGLGDWKISGYKTDLAVSKSGLFGFSALQGTSTVELSWAKAKNKNLEDSEEQVLELSTDMSNDQIVQTISQSSEFLLQRLESDKKRRKQKELWTEKVLTIHEALQGIALDHQQKFTPSKFRVDLTLSYSAPLFGLTKLSGDARLRLEWKIVQNSSKSKREQKLINNLVEDINVAMSKITPVTNQGYKFDQFAVALGLNKKSLLSFSKVKGGVNGVLFFKVNKEKSEVVPVISNDEDYSWVEDESKERTAVKRDRFRQGLVKTVGIGNWFSEKLSRRQALWSVNKFKVNFTMSYSGLFGLSTTGGSGEIELYYSK
ncbi:MAG: hypothetical protein COW00_07580 [Bdellovibrio sp. CG12_big_fil_rev_8_21_14_0_65_39_13]|nr:MAG: hypothetical protein COW78_12260 [Bdellovibrio sp. CG22_combo_CG10-13_8_21_14_all_39_27]PIQ60116.1 MAG: hypothetical protein COW00_07580 [Bdellovibrio sp. CG12_big_fil_rev_8_21_14_0_65_39_13]PIR36752.1 MAG: hypothetical protein COV37_01080 [Bdellovibrio sp. CG11_big_fil_rev_8_21_14_0_20_39_38]PJB53804.1 MAG: hypothetical protein CO099_05140 [Bdellovibrio sp. CG_4_9_14_3_um_filter_39_7]